MQQIGPAGWKAGPVQNETCLAQSNETADGRHDRHGADEVAHVNKRVQTEVQHEGIRLDEHKVPQPVRRGVHKVGPVVVQLVDDVELGEHDEEVYGRFSFYFNVK